MGAGQQGHAIEKRYQTKRGARRGSVAIKKGTTHTHEAQPIVKVTQTKKLPSARCAEHTRQGIEAKKNAPALHGVSLS